MRTSTVGARVRAIASLAVALSFAVAACEEGPFLVSGVAIGNLTISQPSLSLSLEESDSVALSVFDIDGMPVVGQRATWSSDNTAVATVDGSNTGATITAVAEGSTIV
ncbi:MAG: hypothetical protein ACR2QM_19750, partial [Longimicrobiales bacterium]